MKSIELNWLEEELATVVEEKQAAPFAYLVSTFFQEIGQFTVCLYYFAIFPPFLFSISCHFVDFLLLLNFYGNN